jgi:hypothetical protein
MSTGPRAPNCVTALIVVAGMLAYCIGLGIVYWALQNLLP